MRLKRKELNVIPQNAGSARRFFTCEPGEPGVRPHGGSDPPWGLTPIILVFCIWGLTPMVDAAPLATHTAPSAAALAPSFPAPKVTVSVVKSRDGFIVDATLEVAAAPATVWDVFTDFEHMTAIVTNLTYSHVLSSNGNVWVVQQKGEAKFGLLSYPFESVREIRTEPMKRMMSKNISGTFKSMESELQLIPTAFGPSVKYHAEGIADSIFAKLFGLSFMRHEFEEQFTAMAVEMQKRQMAAK